MKLAVPRSQNGPFTSSPLQAVNWLGLEYMYACLQALGPRMQKPQRVRNSRDSLAGPWLASGSEVTTTFTGSWAEERLRLLSYTPVLADFGK